jgi:hypothetical protein
VRLAKILLHNNYTIVDGLQWVKNEKNKHQEDFGSLREKQLS